MRYGTFFSHIGNPSGNQRPHNSIFVGGTLKGSDYEDKRLKNYRCFVLEAMRKTKVKRKTLGDLRVAPNT